MYKVVETKVVAVHTHLDDRNTLVGNRKQGQEGYCSLGTSWILPWLAVASLSDETSLCVVGDGIVRGSINRAWNGMEWYVRDARGAQQPENRMRKLLDVAYRERDEIQESAFADGQTGI
ncbi:hypothetical protein PV325_005397 [Microctonus aethiopoides]|nr:hypothetical protein PV325_005397 [Microctonus aethiopoides]KAK0098494.1 hypothetical protein PV326_007755 [Microctonus aethiopoides]